MLISNIVVGLIPVLLAIVIFTLALSGQAQKSVKDSLASKLSDIKQKFDDEMETYRSYSYFFARGVKTPATEESMKGQLGYAFDFNVNVYGLKLLEFTWQDKVVRSSFNLPATSVYAMNPEFTQKLWGLMNKPFNQGTFKMSYPEIVSNVLVIRNAALVTGDHSEKIGLAVVSKIIDTEYLQRLSGDNSDLIVFTQTPEGGFAFSNEKLTDEADLDVLRKVEMGSKPYAVVSVMGQKYYMAKMPLFVIQGKTIADIGILYGFESVNKIMTMFQKVSIIVFLVSVLIAVLIAIILAGRITAPIISLEDMASGFETNFTPIPLPNNMRDELDELQKVFSSMSASIITKTSELQKANSAISALVEQQNGDYFLTSLLIQPLVPNAVESDIVNVRFYINQKKKFRFRRWEAQLGGDICIARMIVLRGKRYVAFVNGDAMGKSMQGAGGALVMGVVMNSIIDRTLGSRSDQAKSPRQWLEETYNQLEQIFESFDGSMMMSGIFGLIEEDTGNMVFFNAEHPWLVLYRDGIAIFAEDESKVGRKLGTVGFSEVFIKDMRLRPGDVLFIGSDGKDDVKIGVDKKTGNRIINEDEQAFLRHVETAHGDIEKVAEEVERSGELTDDFTMIRLGFLEDFDSRKEELEKAGIRLGPDGNVVSERSNISIGEGYDTSQKFKKMDEQKAEAYSLYKNGKFEEVLKILESLRGNYNRSEDNFQVLYLLGHCLVKMQNYDEAVSVWEEALNFDPENEKLVRNIQSIKNYKE